MKNSEVVAELKEIRKSQDEQGDKLVQIDTNLTNHLKHHENTRNWLRWIFPTSLGVLNLIIVLITVAG